MRYIVHFIFFLSFRRGGLACVSGTRLRPLFWRHRHAIQEEQELDENNEVSAEVVAPHHGEYVAAIAWIANDLLAVGEIDGDVEFFGVSEGLELTLRGRWRPDPRPARGLSAMVSANNILAVGFRDGRLVFVDVSQLPERFDDGTEYWLLN